MLYLIKIIRKDFGRYANDKRKKVNYILAEYKDNDGFVYRKSFTSYNIPKIPKARRQKELKEIKNQDKQK